MGIRLCQAKEGLCTHQRSERIVRAVSLLRTVVHREAKRGTRSANSFFARLLVGRETAGKPRVHPLHEFGFRSDLASGAEINRFQMIPVLVWKLCLLLYSV